MQNMMAYYINIFRDSDGNITGSEDGIMNTLEKAQAEAIRYVLEHGWTYIDTASTYSYRVDFTSAIDAERLTRAEQQAENNQYGTYDQQVRSHHASLIRLPS